MKTGVVSSKMLLFLYVLFALSIAQAGYTQDEVAKFPDRTITLIFPTPPGNPGELAARLISKEAEKFLGKPIVILNKPGAALTIGTAAIAAAKPDGYTIGYVGGPPLFITPFLEKVPYDAIRDFKMIIQYGGTNFGVIVKSDSSFKSFKDMIEFARQNPRKLTYATAGTNSLQHITMERIARKENVQITHIPFKGTAESQAALLGGHIQFAAGDFNYSLIEAGQTRLLLLLRDEPSAEYPQTPILKDLGYDYLYPMYLALGGPKGIPDGIVERLHDAFAKAMKQPAFISGMKELRQPIVYRNTKDLNEYVAQNYEVFSKLIKGGELSK